MDKETVNQVTTATNQTSITSTAGSGLSPFVVTTPATVGGVVEGSKTFTQEELNQMIGERLARERAKYQDYESLKEKAAKYDQIEEESKTELQKATERADKLEEELNKLKKEATIRAIREEVANEIGVPITLLTAETKDDCEAQAKAILSFAKPDVGYPTVKDAGEVRNASSASTRDQFEEWFNEQL